MTAHDDRRGVTWRTSSHSDGGEACVEVGVVHPGARTHGRRTAG
jgi:hypothetical protein